MLTGFSKKSQTDRDIVIESEGDAIDEVLQRFDQDDRANQEEDDDKDENKHLDNPEGGEEDGADKEEDKHFEKNSKMYIKDGTREGYNASNRLFLLWHEKRPECVSNSAKKAFQETFEAQVAATVKHKNKAVTASVDGATKTHFTPPRTVARSLS